MNDYTRTIQEDNPVPAQHGLNEDTAVRSILDYSRSFLNRTWLDHMDLHDTRLSPSWNFLGHVLAPYYFNITEDWSIGKATTFGFKGHYNNHAAPDEEGILRPKHDAMLSLLRNPLPHDLPAGDKDVLILMAAYHGDIRRYARLRRPVYVSINEDYCVRRDTHHNTGFARWMLHDQPRKHYIQAINARFIMSNDLSPISEDQPPDDELPLQIWYPTRAAAEPYVELARRRSCMRPAVARALIVTDYRTEREEKMNSDFEFTDEMFTQAVPTVLRAVECDVQVHVRGFDGRAARREGPCAGPWRDRRRARNGHEAQPKGVCYHSLYLICGRQNRTNRAS
ncbi:hypothetical protein RB600_010258 [Gaeumannomyces tritici]